MKRIVTIVFLGLVALVLLAATVVSIVKLTKVPDAWWFYTLLMWLPGRIANIYGLAGADYNDAKVVVGSMFSLIVGLLYHPLLLLVYSRYGLGDEPIMFLCGMGLLQMIIHGATYEGGYYD